MAYRIEEEELRLDDGPHEHHDTSADDDEETNDVHAAKCVKDDVSWTSQGL